jgi:hypothetical protein
MQLPDFRRDQRFVRLREEMGADQLVEVRMTEWRDWVGRGVDIHDSGLIEVNPIDKTLSYEGRRILVYIRDQYVNADDTPRGYRYHVAECRTLRDMRSKRRFGRYVGTQRTDGVFMVNLMRFRDDNPFLEDQLIQVPVCKNCLGALDWRSYSQQDYFGKNRLVAEFRPDEFLEEFGSLVTVLPSHSPLTSPINGYPSDWPETSLKFRISRQWTCEECGWDFSDPPTRRWLHVHHVDGNRANSFSENLKALCIECHAKQPDHQMLRFGVDYLEYIRWKRDENKGRGMP